MSTHVSQAELDAAYRAAHAEAAKQSSLASMIPEATLEAVIAAAYRAGVSVRDGGKK